MGLPRLRDGMVECSFIAGDKKSFINVGECISFLLLLQQIIISLDA